MINVNELQSEINDLEYKKQQYRSLYGTLNGIVNELRNSLKNISTATDSINGGMSGAALTNVLTNNNAAYKSIEAKISKISGIYQPEINEKINDLEWTIKEKKNLLAEQRDI